MPHTHTHKTPRRIINSGGGGGDGWLFIYTHDTHDKLKK